MLESKNTSTVKHVSSIRLITSVLPSLLVNIYKYEFRRRGTLSVVSITSAVCNYLMEIAGGILRITSNLPELDEL